MHIQIATPLAIGQLKGYYSFTAITQEFVPPHDITKYIIVYSLHLRSVKDMHMMR